MGIKIGQDGIITKEPELAYALRTLQMEIVTMSLGCQYAGQSSTKQSICWNKFPFSLVKSGMYIFKNGDR